MALDVLADRFPPQPDEAFWSGPLVSGESYHEVLSRLHSFLSPQTYLEIGVWTGNALALANCATIAVDPAFQIDKPVLGKKPYCGLYQLTSDAFFAQFSPSAIFGRPIDLAFLDGLHQFEFLLRDFINTEKHSRRNSVICLHDCIPADSYVARRNQADTRFSKQTSHHGWWAGDVWKVPSILMKYRPDLKLHAFDAEPTGLVAITNLDPTSTVLEQAYFDILSEFSDLSLSEAGDNYISKLPMHSTLATRAFVDIGKLFWL